MSRRSATLATTMNLSSLTTFLRTLESNFDSSLTKAVRSAAANTEIDQDELRFILDEHFARVTALARRALPSSSLNPSPFDGFVPGRKPYTTPDSSKSPEKPVKKSTFLRWGGSKAGGRKSGVDDEDDDVEDDDVEDDDDDALVKLLDRSSNPRSHRHKINAGDEDIDYEEDTTIIPDRISHPNSITRKSSGASGSTSKLSSRPAVEIPSAKKDATHRSSSPDLDDDSGLSSIYGSRDRPRGTVGGASRMFGRNGSRPHTPIKPKKPTYVNLDDDSEDAEAEEGEDETLFCSDGKNNGGARKTWKRKSGGRRGDDDMAKHEAAKKRSEEIVDRMKTDQGKNPRSKSKSGKDRARGGGGGESASRKRTFETRGVSGDEDEESDITPSKKKHKSKRKSKSKRSSSSHNSSECNREREREREREATLSVSNSNRKKLEDAYFNSHNISKTIVTEAETEVIDLCSDIDEGGVDPKIFSSSVNFSGAMFGGRKNSNKIEKNFVSPKDLDRKYGVKVSASTTPTPTPSKNQRDMPGSSPLPDKVVGGFVGFRTGAGLGSAAAMESEILRGNADEVASGGCGEAKKAQDDEDLYDA